MRSLLRGAVYLWVLPNTAVGLLLGLLSFQRPRRGPGVVVFDRRVRGFLWLFARTGYRAITFGHVVLGVRPVDGDLLRHELAHVRQYEVLGPLFLPAYLLLYAVRGYRRHPLEVAAARASGVPTRAERPGAPGGGRAGSTPPPSRPPR